MKKAEISSQYIWLSGFSVSLTSLQLFDIVLPIYKTESNANTDNFLSIPCAEIITFIYNLFLLPYSVINSFGNSSIKREGILKSWEAYE